MLVFMLDVFTKQMLLPRINIYMNKRLGSINTIKLKLAGDKYVQQEKKYMVMEILIFP